jgi:hypothetical protein
VFRGEERPHRWFYGTARNVEGVTVAIGGFQCADGSVRDRIGYVVVDPQRNELDAAGLRQLARAAIATADELDWLSDADGRITP